MDNRRARVLIVDDEPSILFTVSKLLSADYDVTEFSDSEKAMESLKAGQAYDVLIIDFRLQSISGLDLLIEAKKSIKYYRAILLTAYANKDLLEQVVNEKLIYSVVEKPFEPASFVKLIGEALTDLQRQVKEMKRVTDLEAQLESFYAAASGLSGRILVHKSAAMKGVLSSAKRASSSNANVLITGESGVGKEVVANMIHFGSRRSDKTIARINCAAIPEGLFESELFGHRKGAFTGAHVDRPGRFETANGGTVFLDEISELPLNLQSKLLRVIENREITPLGAAGAIQIDVRIVSATNRNLREMVSQGGFREDLFFRLNVLNIEVPALRERKEDIPLLASYFLQVVANDEGGPTKHFTDEALGLLSSLEFSGNVRELKNLVYRSYLYCEDPTIEPEHIKAIWRHVPRSGEDLFDKTMPFIAFKERVEKCYLERQLKKYEFSLTRTAEQLEMPSSNLSRKLKDLGIFPTALKRELFN